MEIKLQDKIKAAVEVDGISFINLDNSKVFAQIGNEEAFIYIKNTLDEPGKPGKEIKIRFIKEN